MTNKRSKAPSRLQVAYGVALLASLALALTFTGKGLGRTALGIVAVGALLFMMLTISWRLGHEKSFWLSVDFVLLLAALFSAFSGLSARTLSQHEKVQTELADGVKEAYVSALNIGDFVVHECSGSLPVPGTNPQNPCDRVRYFVYQIREERDRPSSVATGRGNRWDRNLCGTEIPAGVRSESWEHLCRSLQELAIRQETVRSHLDQRPKGFFISVLDRGSILLSLSLTAVLLAARSAKFIYDLRRHEK